MNIKSLLRVNNMSMYRLSQISGIPKTTIIDICTGRTNISKSSADTVYKLSKALGVTMEELLEADMQARPTFELFKSNVCHKLKRLGDIDFLIETIESDEINQYYKNGWYPECLYLLAMVDYISRLNDIPLCSLYNNLRKKRLNNTIFPSSVIAAATVFEDDTILERAVSSAIPEFMQHNIVENEVRNVW